jgi:hypothetical protein
MVFGGRASRQDSFAQDARDSIVFAATVETRRLHSLRKLRRIDLLPFTTHIDIPRKEKIDFLAIADNHDIFPAPDRRKALKMGQSH